MVKKRQESGRWLCPTDHFLAVLFHTSEPLRKPREIVFQGHWYPRKQTNQITYYDRTGASQRSKRLDMPLYTPEILRSTFRRIKQYPIMQTSQAPI
jgi:hypothetical protein